MWRLTIPLACLALLGALALPGGAAARAAHASGAGGLVSSLSASACSDEKAEIGKRAFRKRYGRKHPWRACIRRKRGAALGAVKEATRECQAELADEGAEDFYYDWDTFSDCVADYADWIMGGGFGDDEGDDEGDDGEL